MSYANVTVFSDNDFSSIPITKVNSTSDNSNVLPKERREILAALKLMKTLDDNWDGYEAKAPSDLAIALAESFTCNIPFGMKYPDHLRPDGEGGLNFIWRNESLTFILSIEAGLLHFSYDKNNEVIYENDIPYFGGEIPSEVSRLIPQKKIPEEIYAIANPR